MDLTLKQTQALDKLEDRITTEVYYGGAAGGGKSAIGCYWQLKQRIRYPGTRGLLGRAQLKTLKETTLQTFFDIAKRQGIKRGKHFDLTSSQDKEFPNCLVFANKSITYLKDLFLYPQDPEFDELGSLEITDAFIDECPQISVKAKNIVKSRIRYRLDDYGLIPKMLMTGNPTKNWSYYEFYKAASNGELRADRAFIQALPGDNPNLPSSYIETLRGLDKNSRSRLLDGNWEYDDDPAALMDYDAILDCFKNEVPAGKKYITCDVARFGSDSTVIGMWDGFKVTLSRFKGLKTTEVAEQVRLLQYKHEISADRILVDEDGVGGGVVDQLGCMGFLNGGSPIGGENFQNLKSQCYYKLAERVNRGGLRIEIGDGRDETRDLIIEELEQVKQYNMDKDGKRQVLPKDKVKEKIGRSPDYSDTIMMREYFELNPEPEFFMV